MSTYIDVHVLSLIIQGMLIGAVLSIFSKRVMASKYAIIGLVACTTPLPYTGWYLFDSYGQNVQTPAQFQTVLNQSVPGFKGTAVCSADLLTIKGHYVLSRNLTGRKVEQLPVYVEVPIYQVRKCTDKWYPTAHTAQQAIARRADVMLQLALDNARLQLAAEEELGPLQAKNNYELSAKVLALVRK